MTNNGPTNPPPLARTQSISGTPIRITHQQWAHITENHDYMAGCLDMVIETVSDPDLIANGWTDEKIALRHYPKTPITEKMQWWSTKKSVPTMASSSPPS